MARRPIRSIPDPILRQTCEEVTIFDGELERLAEDMVETMYAAPGIGLAAPQVGIAKRLAVVDVSVGEEPDQLKILVNPRISNPRGETSELEGCLSIPELTDKVRRPAVIQVDYQDLQGNAHTMEAEEWTARAISHEVDHLDGILFVDHLRGLRRERMRRQLKKLLRSLEQDKVTA
ncbi:MAG: peptide deformylase [Acidobacteriota bacterium]